MTSPARVGLVRAPGTTRWLPLSGIHDTLDYVNTILGRPAYAIEWIEATDARPASTTWSALFVGADVLPAPDDPLQWLHKLVAGLDPQDGVLAGVDLGATWLACADLLLDHACAVGDAGRQWLHAHRPRCAMSGNRMQMDARRLTCVGGLASVELMVAWVQRRHGHAVAQAVAHEFGVAQPSGSPPEGAERTPSVPHTAPSRLQEAVDLMRANLHEPLSSQDIADLVGLSRRQLERQFRQHIGTLPARWYLEQRLLHAQTLLRHGTQSIMQIGLACGFASAAHFSSAYRSFHGRTPRDERAILTQGWQRPPAQTGRPFASEEGMA